LAAPCSSQGQALGARFRGCQEIRRCPTDLSVRRSRASGNPGVSVTCPGPPLSRGRRLERAANLITASLAGTMEERFPIELNRTHPLPPHPTRTLPHQGGGPVRAGWGRCVPSVSTRSKTALSRGAALFEIAGGIAKHRLPIVAEDQVGAERRGSALHRRGPTRGLRAIGRPCGSAARYRCPLKCAENTSIML
jgi:hypothetical protein